MTAQYGASLYTRGPFLFLNLCVSFPAGASSWDANAKRHSTVEIYRPSQNCPYGYIPSGLLFLRILHTAHRRKPPDSAASDILPENPLYSPYNFKNLLILPKAFAIIYTW